MSSLLKNACLTALLFAGFSMPLFAQQAVWREAAPHFEELHGRPMLRPSAYRIFRCDEDSLRRFLDGIGGAYEQASVCILPQPDGGFRRFRVWQTPAMARPLAMRYPGLKTFSAEALDDALVTAKIDYTPFGFHALVFDGGRSFLIDPCYAKASGAYLAYYKRDYTRPLTEWMFCANETELFTPELPRREAGAERLNGGIRKVYRLALAADSEYCAAVAGSNPSKADVLAKMLTTLNRVNGVYERELSLTMQLVANEDTLIFTSEPDPYTNNSGSAMLMQNQATIDARIGKANYDIGHVFSTAGGGIATQACVCDSNTKARGVTGSASPLGDAFDIDFVAHEMGHQFGAGHTFNASTGSCAGNGVRNISYEPGSGSTIMAYAGICGSGNDFQQHSDDYFHFASLDQIGKYITTGRGGTCPQSLPSPNSNPPGLPPFAASYYIPWQTPFELTAPRAIDSSSSQVNYCWEQADIGGADFGKSLALTHIDGPLFRSFPPSTSNTRVFPALDKLLGGLATPGEKLPDTARSLHFRLTARNLQAGWGNFNLADDIVTLQAVQTPAPFTVQSFSTNATVPARSMQTINWDVAGTTDAPIHCASVDIFLSIDGGYTFPYLLTQATANDGSAAVFLPNVPTTDSARIKVKGSGNVFFNLNAVNFRIVHDSTEVPPPAPQVFSVWPVPAAQILHVYVPDSLGNAAFSLFNTLGQAVLRGVLYGSSEVAVGNLPRGVYYLRLRGPKLDAVRPVVLR